MNGEIKKRLFSLKWFFIPSLTLLIISGCFENSDMGDAARGVSNKTLLELYKNNVILGTSSSSSSSSSTGSSSSGGVSQTKPDLIVESITVPSSVYEGELYAGGATVVIKNNSTINVSQVFKVAVNTRKSTTDVYYPQSPYKIGEQSVTGINAGASKSLNIDITFPANSTPGVDYYIGAWVDYESVITESDDDNNKGGYNKISNSYEVGQALKIITVHENKPDITFVAGSFSPASSYTRGTNYNVSVQIKNNGHKNISNVFYVTICTRKSTTDVYYSQSPYKIGEVAVIGLNAGEIKTITVPVLFPVSLTTGSDYYLGVWLDSQNNVTELSTEIKGEGDANKGGYDASSQSYSIGDFLKVITLN